MQCPDSAPSPDDPITLRAIQWLVRLRARKVEDREYAAFQAWRQADPRHETAAAKLEQALGLFANLPDSPASRERVRRSLLALVDHRRVFRNLVD